jgi:hypothetical protein
MLAPPDMWYHQHFNIGSDPARYLALRRGGSPEHPLRLAAKGGEEAGAEQIEYENEDPEIRRIYEHELRSRGIAIRMPPLAPQR